MIRQRNQAESGFTLIELVIAGVILTIASVALAATMAQTTSLAATPREEVAARNAIRGCIAELSSTPFDKVASMYQDTDFFVSGLTVQSDDADGKCGRVRFEYGPGGDTGFYTVTVRVDWRGRVGNRSLESVHYLANVRGDTGTPTPLEQITAGTAEITVGEIAGPRIDPTVDPDGDGTDDGTGDGTQDPDVVDPAGDSN